MQQRNISNRSVAAMTVERDTVFWDRTVTGFGVRVYPTGGKVYIAQARGPEGPKRVTVGRHGVLNADEARQRAALIVTRIKAGEDPVPLPLAARARANGSPTVANLAARYLEDHVEVRLKPRTQVKTRGVLRRHILPALGKMPVEAVERRHAVELHRGLSDRPVTANRAIKTLSHMYRLGEGWGLVPAGCNPCRSIEKYPERGRERFLTDAEFARLGRVLDEAVDAGTVPPEAAAAIRLLMLTGCRKGEVLALRWTDVDLDAGELRLPDAKSGPRAVQLPPPAVRLLEDLPHRAGSPWVFPGRDRDGHYSAGGLDRAWYAVREAAKLEDVRIHDLRHSFASRALALGETLPVIGKLLGHNDIETTARYAHLAQDSVHEAAERIAASIAAHLLD
ncbi:MAG: tyrosine-type recombinase/integrase [Rhodospirillaceae bacterium]|nr:tyrosine-type recombinase/integrase [Rhodospirillaceae bacterium]